LPLADPLSTYWLLADLTLTGDELYADRLLKIEHPYAKFNQLKLYLYANGKLVAEQTTGEGTAYGKRPTSGLLMAFSMKLETGIRYQILIAARSHIRQNLKLELESPIEFAASEGTNGIKWGT